MTTYSTGTISVGAGSTSVTGSGTNWATAGLRAGDQFETAGLSVRIASINSATSITLARAWPGSTLSGANYDIWLIPDDERALTQVNLLLQALGSDTITSLGGLTSAANLMPYWTGPGVMATTALTPAARTLLDDADVAAMRTTLGVGVAHADGTAVAPSIAFAADLNTGIFRPTTDSLGISAGGAERLRIGSNGNVGIGTSSPATALDVVGTVTADGLTVDGDGYFGGATVGGTDYPLRIQNTDTGISAGVGIEFSIDGVNDVIGSTIRSDRTGSAHHQSAVTISNRRANGAGLVSGFKLDQNGDISFYEDTGTTPKFFWDASAERLGIGTTSPATTLDVNGDVTITDKIIHSGDTNTAIRFPAADTVTVETAGSERMRIDSSGNLLIGGTTAGTASAGNLVLVNGTAPTGNVTNGITLYAEDVSSSSELKVRDEAGNVTTLSPHNFDLIPEGPSEEMAWSYYSERDGKRINVDMLKAIRLLEQITGEKLVHIV